MTLEELRQLRAEKVKEMETLVEQRSDNMDDTALAAVTSIKDEIGKLDKNIKAIEDLRSVIVTKSDPVKAKSHSETEIRAAFNDYLKGNITEKEWEQRANTVGANGDVVPEDFLKELLEAINEYGTISPSARHITTDDNGELSIPTINDTANAGIWTAEGGAIALQDFSTGTITMNAYKVATGIEVSTELIEDSFFDLSSYVAKALGVRLGRTMEAAYIKGDGTGKPLGILEDTSTVIEQSETAGTVTSVDLTKMIRLIPPSQRIGAGFLVSDDVLGALLLEKDSDGRPLLQRSADATAANDIIYTIAGYPIRVNYELDAIATGKSVAIFGNLSSYFIRDVRSVSVKRDDYSAMGTDMVRFYATSRVDGKVANANTCFAVLEIA